MTEQRKQQLERVQAAIREGCAYIDTYLGKLQVRGYNDGPGYASTGKGYCQRTWVITLDAIIIEEA